MRISGGIASLFLIVLLPAAPSVISSRNVEHERVLLLGVYAPSCRFVRGIDAGQVVVKGVRASVQSLEFDDSPRHVVLLLDVSSSMGVNRLAWPNIVAVAKEFLGTLQNDDWIALHIFATRHIVLLPPTHDFSRASSLIDSISPPGTNPSKRKVGFETHLKETLAEIMRDGGGELGLGDAVVLITDQDTIGGLSREDPVRVMGSAGVRLFLLQANLSVFPPSSTVPGQSLSTHPESGDIALATGGTIFAPWAGQTRLSIDRGLMRENVQSMYSLIREVYRVELRFTAPGADSRHLTVQILDRNGKKSPRLTPIYPRCRQLPEWQ
ncbi:MAG: VWA domain-containing protein [Acidobacteriia bacterium]|nr:VWA domain-containing protein [Terriglobia bacterium]